MKTCKKQKRLLCTLKNYGMQFITSLVGLYVRTACTPYLYSYIYIYIYIIYYTSSSHPTFMNIYECGKGILNDSGKHTNMYYNIITGNKVSTKLHVIKIMKECKSICTCDYRDYLPNRAHRSISIRYPPRLSRLLSVV